MPCSVRKFAEHLVCVRNHRHNPPATLSSYHGHIIHRNNYAAALGSLHHRWISPPPQGGWLQRRQQHSARLLNGSALPLSSLLHSRSHRCFHHSHCEVSHPLPRSRYIVPVPQETLLGFGSNSFHLCPSSGVSKLPSSSDFIFRLFSSVPVLHSDYLHERALISKGLPAGLSLGKFDFLKNVNLNHRGFSSSVSGESDSDAEVDCDCVGEVGDDGNGEVGNGSEGVRDKSEANPKEVDRVCKIIEELFALDRNMEAVLDGCGVNLSHDLVIDVLERFRHARKPAFRFFNWAEDKSGYSHDSRTYNKMMEILGKTRQFETMVALLEEMGGKGLLTIETFKIAIKAFAAAKERKKAVGMFELMKRHKFRVGVDTINCLLDNLGRAKLGKEAQTLFEKLEGRFTPNLQTYTVLLNGWCRIKNLMEIGKAWNEMVDKGFKPDVVTHNTMLEGLLRCNQRADAIKLFEVMKAKGPSPNVRSYTIMIRDLCKQGKMKEAVKRLDEIIDHGYQPDAALYTCLITGFGNQKKMDMVYGLLKEMKEKGCPADGQTYNALIKLMANRKLPDDAVRIYKKMIQSGIQPTIHTYNMMMKSFFLTRNYEMGCDVWEEMIQKGCCPDDNSYIVFIGGLIRHGRAEEACKYLEEMLEKGMKAPQLDYNKFAADFSRAGKPDILEELAQKMKFSGKFEVSNIFARWAEMMKKRVKRRDVRPARQFV